jgi:pilus assembly protein CpaF
LRREVSQAVSAILSSAELALNATERDQLVDDVAFEVAGFGPLEPLLADPTIDDIIINGHKRLYVERNGVLERTASRFRDEAHLMNIIQRIVSPLGRRVDESSPFVDARLPNGSRVNIVVPPIAIDGPIVSIRKFKQVPLSARDLVESEALSQPMLDHLSASVRARLNILISGGTGSGKTTLLNVLSGYISPQERLVTIEDAAELQLRQPHVARLETRSQTADGTAAVTARDLVRNALRMRPDRIILGEVRGGESVDMLQAMTTGHDGSMATLHANNPQDALYRLELLMGFGGMRTDVATLRRQIASAIQLVVHMQRMGGGERKIVTITEIAGLEGNTITLNEMFKYDQLGPGRAAGSFARASSQSIFADRLAAVGNAPRFGAGAAP